MMTEEELHDQENWFDFGLTDHLDSGQFKDWLDVGREVARIAGCEPGSPLAELFLQCAASAASLGDECAHCGEISRPRNDNLACPKCAEKMARPGIE